MTEYQIPNYKSEILQEGKSARAISVPAPVPGTRLTEEYVRQVGGLAYLWGWPMVNMHHRKSILSKLPEAGLMGGIVPVAPMNQLSMVRDYIDPGERLVAGPNQDVTAPDGSLTIYVLATPPERRSTRELAACTQGELRALRACLLA
jgi:hypothetical protein